MDLNDREKDFFNLLFSGQKIDKWGERNAWFFLAKWDSVTIKMWEDGVGGVGVEKCINFNGEWLHGDWNGDIFENGTWVGGMWYGGIWRNGIWKKGWWKTGVWKNGTWNDGTWKGGAWKNGIWNDGTWEKGSWDDGIWKGGDWLGGYIYDLKAGKYEYSNLPPNECEWSLSYGK